MDRLLTPKRRLSKALLLYRKGRIYSARRLCEKILAKHADQRHAQELLGLISMSQDNLEEAIYHFRKSLSKLRTNAVCHHRLAYAYDLNGEKEKAAYHYHQALKTNPDYVTTYFHLAYIEGQEKNDMLIENIERLLKKRDLSEHQRALLHFSAAKCYDRKSLFDRAFNHAAINNQNYISNYFPSKESELTKLTTDFFSPDLYQKFHHAGNKSNNLVFILGMPSSGQALLNNLLTSHDNIGTVNNYAHFALLAKKLDELKAKNQPYPYCIKELRKSSLSACAKVYLKIIGAQKNKDWITNSFCLNFRHVGLIKLLFPNAKFIEIRRHPQDACVEAYFSIMQDHCNFSSSLGELVDCYENYLKLMQHWKTVAANDILSIKLEHLVRDPEPTLDSVFNFLNLTWSKNSTINTSPGFGYHYKIGFSRYYSDFLGELRPRLKVHNMSYKNSS